MNHVWYVYILMFTCKIAQMQVNIHHTWSIWVNHHEPFLVSPTAASLCFLAVAISRVELPGRTVLELTHHDRLTRCVAGAGQLPVGESG